jgi:hypothetical protein
MPTHRSEIRVFKFLPVVLVFSFALTDFQLAEAQQPKKVARIGFLSAENLARESTRSEGIRRLALRERGYIEGQNIAVGVSR